MNWIRERATAILAGSAIGDALGGAKEGFSPEQIQERYGSRVGGIVPPFYRLGTRHGEQACCDSSRLRAPLIAHPKSKASA